MSEHSAPIEINGAAATVPQLSALGFLNYGHSTAMQIRGGSVRGLGLHLTRLDEATQELFRTGLDREYVRGLIRHALGTAGRTDATVRVYVFEPPGESAVSVLVTVDEASDMPPTARALQSVSYQRPVPHLKHIGNFGKLYLSRIAERAGFDGVLLMGPDGSVSEGATTNIGFFDGQRIIWPDAPALRGITMHLLSARLPAYGLPTARQTIQLADLKGFGSAFVTNSRGIAPVSRVDGHSFRIDAELMRALSHAYQSVPWDGI